ASNLGPTPWPDFHPKLLDRFHFRKLVLNLLENFTRKCGPPLGAFSELEVKLAYCLRNSGIRIVRVGLLGSQLAMPLAPDDDSLICNMRRTGSPRGNREYVLQGQRTRPSAY